MGQEMSCTSRGKPIRSLEDGFDAVVDGVEQAADMIDQVIDDATRTAPARIESHLGEKDRRAALALFWQIARAQGCDMTSKSPVIYEDAAMALLLQRIRLIDGDEPLDRDHESEAEAAAASSTPAVATLATMAGRRPVKAMLRRLHLHPVGFWLRGDATRRGYSPDEWTTLVCAASPDALV